MRIGQFNDAVLPVVDGVGRVVCSYAETMSKMGHETYVIAARDASAEPAVYPFEFLGYKAKPFFFAKQYQAGIPVLDRQFERKMDQIPFDIFHVHSPFLAGREALRLSKKMNIPVVGSFHSKYYDDFYKMFKNEALARYGAHWVADFYKKCDLVFAVSHNSAQVLKSYGYDKEVLVIPNGTDLRPMQDERAEAIRQTYPGRRILLFVGQMNWKKNILRVLEVSAALKQKGEPIVLILIGRGPDTEAIKKKAGELGLSDAAVFLDHIDDRDRLDSYYQAADLFLFPSIYDNAPMVVREAAVMGTPSLLIEGSSAAEAVKKDEDGFLCPDETGAITEKVTELLHHPALLEEAGKRAQEHIPIPWEQVVEVLLQHYETLIQMHAQQRKKD